MTEQKRLNRLNQYKHVLEITKEFAFQASITGMQSGGEKRCIQMFNKILMVVEDQLVTGLVEPLNADANYSEISIACTQLLALLDENHEEDYRNNRNKSQGVFGDFENLFQGFDNDFQDVFRDLGKKVRDNIPQVIKDKVAEELHRASEEIKKAEARVRKSSRTDTNQADYTEIVIEDEKESNEDNSKVTSSSEILSDLKRQVQELKAELEAAKPNVSQELEVGAESLNGIDAGQNIESSEIPIEEINSKSNTDKTRGKNKK